MSQSDMRTYGRRRSKSVIIREIERIEHRIQEIQAQPEISDKDAQRANELSARKAALRWVLRR